MWMSWGDAKRVEGVQAVGEGTFGNADYGNGMNDGGKDTA